MNGVFARGLILAALAIGVGGCVDENTQGIVVKRALLFDTTCKPDLAGTGALASGAYDIQTSRYVISLEVQSNIVAIFDQDGRKIDGKRLFVYKGVDVSLSSSNETFKTIDAKHRSYIVPGFGTIEPTTGVGASESKLAATISLLPPELINDNTYRQLAAQPGGFRMFADMQVFGSVDSDSISANTVRFAIDVCDGCLLKVLGTCDQFKSDFSFSGSECFPGQDETTQCCMSAANTPICPGMGTMM